MQAQLKKGILEMCVLFMISENEMYGYDVMKNLKKNFPDVHESTFYAILRRLNSDNYAEVRLGKESNGPARKYYKISDKGKEYLNISILEWQKIRDIVSDIGIS